jgi:sulfur-carrier protein
MSGVSRKTTREGPPAAGRTVVRVHLPHHLRTLAGVEDEVRVEVPGDATTIGGVVEALEVLHPVLKGTIREHGGGPRRAYLRYFACGEDLSHEPPDHPLPEPVRRGEEPFQVVGAIAGG